MSKVKVEIRVPLMVSNWPFPEFQNSRIPESRILGSGGPDFGLKETLTPTPDFGLLPTSDSSRLRTPPDSGLYVGRWKASHKVLDATNARVYYLIGSRRFAVQGAGPDTRPQPLPDDGRLPSDS